MHTTPHPALSPTQRGATLTVLKHPKLLLIEILAGLVTALALIPEALAFSVVAGVDPQVGLFACFTMATTIAITGGRRAMISGAAGSTALVIAPLMATHGLPHLIAAVLLAGVLQILLAVFGVAKLMRFIPRQVMVGFVNALAILIFSSQLPQLIDVPFAVYPLVVVGLIIVFGLPKITTTIPAPLIAIILLTAVTIYAGIKVPTVGEYGELPHSLPVLSVIDVPLTVETLKTIFPFALAMAFVGLVESLMTAKLVDDITDTHSNKTRESWGQGVANIVTAAFGGMGGCAMIGQTMINVKTGNARSRVSTFCAGIFVLVLSVVLGDIVARIPMAALVAVMILVAISTFNWHSVRWSTLKAMPRAETAVMLMTVLVTVGTHNLALGVGIGILVAMVLFARRVAHVVTVERAVQGEDTVTYSVNGPLFFASSNDLYYQFSYSDDPKNIVIDLSNSHVWDASTVSALDSIIFKYETLGKTATVFGLNEMSHGMNNRLSGKLG
ncbi:SulP family inorganic anion transporter [Rothia sp. P7181]|uniref:SulP family inorganic anion transporter n=1 Tax=unclassified Rothia (in: high G+C Gram-positive bacteria) TaxID=2689056 RepID=UPI003AC966C1